MNIGIIGMGTVGTAVVKYILDSGADRLRISKIAVRDLRKKRDVKVPPEILTDRYQEVIDSPDVDVVIELTGNPDLSYKAAISCLQKGKHFITATKTTISEKGSRIFAEAKKRNLYIGYRATIVGLFPILSFIQFATSSGKRVTRISSVLNGTCNFILDEMEREAVSYESAVKKAVELGFAEPDPSADVSGFDTALKLKIILRLLFGNEVADRMSLTKKVSYGKPLLVYRGIEGVALEDLTFAREMGYRLKLLGLIFDTPKGYAACVEPAFVRSDTIIASLKGPENGIEIKDDRGELSGWFGHGAGPEATRIAVMQDVESILSGATTLFPQENGKKVKISGYEHIATRYFLKLYALDKPGVLAKIAGVLGECKINIASVLQKETARGRARYVPVIITTYQVSGENIARAQKLLRKLNIVDSRRLSCYRIIE